MRKAMGGFMSGELLYEVHQALRRCEYAFTAQFNRSTLPGGARRTVSKCKEVVRAHWSAWRIAMCEDMGGFTSGELLYAVHQAPHEV